DNSRKRIDHTKAVACRRGDQQPAVVGAEIERGINAGIAAWRRTYSARRGHRGLHPPKAVARTGPGISATLDIIIHGSVFPQPLGSLRDNVCPGRLAAQTVSATAHGSRGHRLSDRPGRLDHQQAEKTSKAECDSITLRSTAP